MEATAISAPVGTRELAASISVPAWHRLHKSPQAVFGMTVAVAFVLVAVLAGWLAPYDYDDQSLSDSLTRPIWMGGARSSHLLGTDALGRDTLSRLIFGARTSLIVGIVSVGLAALIGSTIGVVAGYFEGRLGGLLMRVADVQYSFPYILLAIVIIAFWGPGLRNVVIVLGLSAWMTFARTARGSTLAVKEEDYVMAARALGATQWRIIGRYILPNITAPLLVFATFQIPSAMLAEATLSFLGLGIKPPMPSWGGMLAQNRGFLTTEPWLVFLPGLSLMTVALAMNQLGDGLLDLLDPRLRGRL
jgi:ABC-type dipeptide/oligopeptide/nickel transport system permease subunit